MWDPAWQQIHEGDFEMLLGEKKKNQCNCFLPLFIYQLKIVTPDRLPEIKNIWLAEVPCQQTAAIILRLNNSLITYKAALLTK